MSDNEDDNFMDGDEDEYDLVSGPKLHTLRLRQSSTSSLTMIDRSTRRRATRSQTWTWRISTTAPRL